MQILVLIGVAGSGKTTLGEFLGGRLSWPYKDADDLHPVSNIDKVRRGLALTDADRWPWLTNTSNWIAERESVRESGIVSCSALKRSYRSFLRARSSLARFIYLKADINLVRTRLSLRAHHFFPVHLLEEQFRILEEPAADESVLIVDASKSVGEIADCIVDHIGPM